jgi:hypothetical protein
MIYATLVSPQPGKYNPVRWAATGAVALALLMGSAAAQPNGPWREAPEFVSLFAPVGPRASVYRGYISPLDLDAALRLIRADPSLSRTQGAWEPQPLPPLDAFGRAGAYDRSKVVRLYGSRRPVVARGVRAGGGGIVEAWTLISPYPDAALQRLEPGTLLLVLRLE